MRLDEMVKIGQVFEVHTHAGCAKTKLQDILGNGQFIVSLPTHKGVPLHAGPDEYFRFVFYRPTGMFTFEAELMESFIREDLRLCRFSQVGGIKRKQRRDAYRLPVILDVVMQLKEEGNRDNTRQFRGRTTNISEKSIELTCFSKISAGTVVIASVQFPEETAITLESTVLKCKRPENRHDPFVIVLVFDCPERDRTRIRRCIFRQQVRTRIDSESPG